MNAKSIASSRGSACRVSRAGPTRMSQTSATPARSRFDTAIAARSGSTSQQISLPPGASPRAMHAAPYPVNVPTSTASRAPRAPTSTVNSAPCSGEIWITAMPPSASVSRSISISASSRGDECATTYSCSSADMGRNFSIMVGRTLACTEMRRPVMTACALALAAAPSACGDGASSPADAVRAYNNALADGNGDKACAQLDPAAQKELQDSTQGAARGSCKKVIELIAAFYDDATKDRLRAAKVAASEQGDRGSARFSSPTGLGGPDRAQTYQLRRIKGEWKITSLGLRESDLGAP